MNASVQDLLDAFRARTPTRAGSLIVTVFGDAAVPRGGSLSLGSLLAIMRAFGVNDGQVRTALSRLVADGWFARARIGRNSFYTLTAEGRGAFAGATRRIYDAPLRRWDGSFAMVLLDNGDDRGSQRAALAGEGFGALAPGLFISADVEGATRVQGAFVRLTASAPDAAGARRLAELAWPIRDIESRYRQFIALFADVGRAVEEGAAFDDMAALVVRILLIHEYRRVILKDPLLPPDLLPSPWAGAEARHLCGLVYRAMAPRAEGWLDAHAKNERGPLPPPDQSFRRRFRP